MPTLNNYDVMITELKSDIEYGSLKLEDTMQILIENDVIIDYYYSHERSIELNNPDMFDTEEEIILNKFLYDKYLMDKPNLIEITCKELIDKLAGYINKNTLA